MRKVDTNVDELVGMIERGELRLPKTQRRYASWHRRLETECNHG